MATPAPVLACNLLVGQSQVFTMSVVNAVGTAQTPASGNLYSIASLGSNPALVTATLFGSTVTVTAVAAGTTSISVADSEGDTAATINYTGTPVPVNNIVLVAGAVTGI